VAPGGRWTRAPSQNTLPTTSGRHPTGVDRAAPVPSHSLDASLLARPYYSRFGLTPPVRAGDDRALTGVAAHRHPPPLSPGVGLSGAERARLKQNPPPPCRVLFPKMKRGLAPF